MIKTKELINLAWDENEPYFLAFLHLHLDDTQIIIQDKHCRIEDTEMPKIKVVDLTKATFSVRQMTIVKEVYKTPQIRVFGLWRIDLHSRKSFFAYMDGRSCQYLNPKDLNPVCLTKAINLTKEICKQYH